MIALVMKGGIPTQIGKGDAHTLCEFVCLTAEHIPPRLSVIVAEPFGIFTTQRDHGGPDETLMLGNRFRYLG